MSKTVNIITGIAIFILVCELIATLAVNNHIFDNLLIKPSPSPLSKVTQTVIPDQPVFGTPVSLVIPKIQVQSAIEQVGLDKTGAMDIPQNPADVAWYKLGYKLGEIGSAVISGHLDLTTGKPSVFWDLGKLDKGDVVVVVDDKGNSLKYQVVDKQSYPYDQFPMDKVFTAKDSARLNLITCSGAWHKAQKNYDHRLVVYTKLVTS